MFKMNFISIFISSLFDPAPNNSLFNIIIVLVFLALIENDNDEIDCLHPSIDVGVYSQPTTITVNISYMAGKAGVFVLPKIEFRETRSGEVFPIKDYCTIVVEDD